MRQEPKPPHAATVLYSCKFKPHDGLCTHQLSGHFTALKIRTKMHSSSAKYCVPLTATKREGQEEPVDTRLKNSTPRHHFSSFRNEKKKRCAMLFASTNCCVQTQKPREKNKALLRPANTPRLTPSRFKSRTDIPFRTHKLLGSQAKRRKHAAIVDPLGTESTHHRPE